MNTVRAADVVTPVPLSVSVGRPAKSAVRCVRNALSIARTAMAISALTAAAASNAWRTNPGAATATNAAAVRRPVSAAMAVPPVRPSARTAASTASTAGMRFARTAISAPTVWVRQAVPAAESARTALSSAKSAIDARTAPRAFMNADTAVPPALTMSARNAAAATSALPCTARTATPA